MSLQSDGSARGGVAARLRRCLGLSALVVAALVCALLTLEVPAILGWVDYRYTVGVAESRIGPEIGPYHAYTTVRQDARGDLVPYYGLTNTERRKIEFRTDRRGFRNPADPADAALIVLGDSFVENSLIPDDELFTALLGRALGVNVVNLGHNGWGPEHELDSLRSVGLALSPRAVLWMFYEGNDIADALVYNGPTEWTGRLFTTNAEVRLAALAESVLYGQTRKNYGWGDDAPPYGSCTAPCREPPCPRLYIGNLAGPLSFFEEIGVRRTFNVLAEADSDARRHGVALVLVFVPVTLRVYRDICSFDEDNPAHRSAFNDLPDRMRTWARTQGIGFVDLTPPLAKAAAQGELVYFPDDTHWTARGNAVVASALAADPVVTKALAGAAG